LCLALCSLTACSLSDLRPDEMKTVEQPKPDSDDAARARALLEEVAQAHGGLDQLKRARVAQVKLRDTWPGPIMRLFGSPWSTNPQELLLTWQLGQDNATLELLNGGKKDHRWGVQQWCTWTQEPDGERRFEAHEDAWFWLPTLEYFIEAPWRLREAQTLAMLPAAERDGERYERVFMTWGSAAPQEDTDQYIAWVHAETKQLKYLEFTARDVYGFVVGIAIYNELRRVDGLLFPGSIDIVQDRETFTDTLHRLDLTSIRTLPDHPDAEIVPDPSCRATKSAKGAPKRQ
jgi:hypothetical protein